MPLSALTVPDQVAAADAMTAALDACFVAGFARMGAAQRDALASVSRTFAGTPLAEPVAAATSAATGSVPGEQHLVALAAARESLSGARHDALLAHAVAALDGAVAVPPDDALGLTAATPDAPTANLMAGARHWLLELALGGLARIDVQALAPFSATLEAIQDQPALGRLAALLTGFMDELMEHAPTSAMDEVPARRWTDLWCRAMLAAHALPPVPASSEVSGQLRVLGADIRHHDHAATLTAYGLLDIGEDADRLVRCSLTCWKVDAVAGDEVWTLFEGAAKPLLDALAGRHALKIAGMQLLATGDLIWTGKASKAAKFDPIDAAVEALCPGAGQSIPTLAPLDRHPAQLVVPIAAAETSFGNTDGEPCIEIDGAAIRFAPTSPLAGLGLDRLRKTRQLFGLLRFDGGWRLQPLCARGGKTWVGPGDAIARARKLRGTTMSVLQERAGKLLRKKS